MAGQEVSAIMQIPLVKDPAHDRLIWLHDRKGVLTAKSAYAFIRNLTKGDTHCWKSFYFTGDLENVLEEYLGTGLCIESKAFYLGSSLRCPCRPG